MNIVLLGPAFLESCTDVEHSVSAFLVSVTSSSADVCCTGEGVLAIICAQEFNGAGLLQLLFTFQRSSAVKSTLVPISD